MSEQQLSEQRTEEIIDGDQPTTVEVKVIEDMARKQGWDPSKGPKTALEFLGDGQEYRDRLYKKLQKTEEKTEQLYAMMAEQVTSLQQEKAEAQRKSVEDQIKDAVDANDHDKVLELTKKLNQPEPKVDPKTDPNIEVVNEWQASQKWWGVNIEMTEDAVAFYKVEMDRMGVDDPKVILPKVEARLKKVHADYFKPANPNREHESGADTGNNANRSKGKGLSRADLTEVEARHLDQFIAGGADEKKLLEQIAKQRAARGI